MRYQVQLTRGQRLIQVIVWGVAIVMMSGDMMLGNQSVGVVFAIEAQAPHTLSHSVLEIFDAKCSECHSPESGKQRANKKWSDALDLTALREEYVIEDGEIPEDPEDTYLWLVLTGDIKRRMPPQKSQAGQLSNEQFNTIRQWLASKAPITPAKTDGLAVGQVSDNSPQVIEPGFLSRLLEWLGKLHPAAVHMPLGLLMAAAMAELLRWFTGRPLFDHACQFCVVLGTLSVVPAAILGWLAGMPKTASFTLMIHRWVGVSVMVLAMLATVLLIINHRNPNKKTQLIFRFLVLLVAALVGLGGHFGGLLVHGVDYYAW